MVLDDRVRGTRQLHQGVEQSCCLDGMQMIPERRLPRMNVELDPQCIEAQEFFDKNKSTELFRNFRGVSDNRDRTNRHALKTQEILVQIKSFTFRMP
jgi:hypothetical protein